MVRVGVLLAMWATTACISAPATDARLEVLAQDWVPAPPTAGLSGLELVDHRGDRFDESRLAGRWSLVFVGYTSCPDVCPTTLAALGPALDELADLDVQGVFLAVDPERDRARLPGLVDFHGEGLVGVTGQSAAIDRAVSQLGASYSRRADGLFDHSTPLFLVDPTGHVSAYILRPSRPAAVAAATRAAIAAGPIGPWLHGGWIRSGPADATVLAGFGTLVNPTGSAARVRSVRGADFGGVHLHQTIEDAGVAQMRRTPELTVGPEDRLELAPGGHHLMLMRPARPLSPGDQAVLRLTLADGDELLARLTVRPR